MSEMFANLSYYISAKQAAEMEYLHSHGDERWKRNNSTWADYGRGLRFAGGITLDEIVTEKYLPGDAGIDLAGGTDAIALRELLDRQILTSALVTNFEDRRSEQVKADDRLDHVAGDLLVPDTWARIIGWQQKAAPEGVGLIIHRPWRILQQLDQSVYGAAADLLVNMLRPGGILFTQIPSSLRGQKRVEFCQALSDRNDIAEVQVASSFKLSGPRHHALITKTA